MVLSCGVCVMCSRLCPLGLHAVGTAALLGSQAEARAAAAEAAEAWLAAFSGFTDAAAAAPPRSPGLPGAALSSIPGPWLSRVAAAAAAAAGAAPVGPRRRPRPPFPVAGMIRGALALDLSALDATTFGHGDSDSTDTVAASAADHVLPAALTARGHAVQVRVAGEGGALPNMDLPNLVLAALRGDSGGGGRGHGGRGGGAAAATFMEDEEKPWHPLDLTMRFALGLATDTAAAVAVACRQVLPWVAPSAAALPEAVSGATAADEAGCEGSGGREGKQSRRDRRSLPQSLGDSEYVALI